MPLHFVTPKDRWLFLAIAAWAIVQSVLMLVDDSGGARVWGKPAWMLLLGAGGAATVVFTITMSSLTLRGWAAACMVVGCAGRGAGLLMGVLNGTAHTTASGLLGVGVWTMLAYLLYFTWRSRVPLPGGTHGWPDA